MDTIGPESRLTRSVEEVLVSYFLNWFSQSQIPSKGVRICSVNSLNNIRCCLNNKMLTLLLNLLLAWIKVFFFNWPKVLTWVVSSDTLPLKSIAEPTIIISLQTSELSLCHPSGCCIRQLKYRSAHWEHFSLTKWSLNEISNWEVAFNLPRTVAS